MPLFQIGERSIEYTLVRSPKAKNASLSITPQSFELRVPSDATEEQINAVLERRRGWILDTLLHMQQRAKQQTRVYRFVSGAKIPYWGRMARLTVERFDDSVPDVTYRNGFHVRYPADLTAEEADAVIESALRLWLKKRVRIEAASLVKRHGPPNDLNPRGVEVKDQKHMWGSCGADRQINLNWHLVFAPKPVFEYAIVHELCHLRVRNHGPEFWQLVGSILPDWQMRKSWLDQNEHLLGWEKVQPAD